MKNFILYLGMGTLFTHELDAMTHHEWRILPLVRNLPEDVALTVFVWVHVPLYAVAIATVASPKAMVQKSARVVIAGFLSLHGVLHLLFSGHHQYEFFSFTSLLLIFGGALLGALYLLMEFWPKVSHAS